MPLGGVVFKKKRGTFVTNNKKMSITVSSIEPQQLRVEIKKCPISVQQYISALERSLERQKDLTNKAIKKLKDDRKR